MNARDACKYLGIEEKAFQNYYKTGEIIYLPRKSATSQFHFDAQELDRWQSLKQSRIVYLTRDEYEMCFSFAIQMAYSKVSSMGSFSRVRSEPEVADNFISGIMAEVGLKKFLKEKYNIEIKLDLTAHPGKGITAQDIVSVNGRPPNMEVAVKSSKEKSCWNVIPPKEYEENSRNSDVYIFARSLLPSDHLFRYLRNDSFFRIASSKLQELVEQQEITLNSIRQSMAEKQDLINSNKVKSKAITVSERDKTKAKDQRDLLAEASRNLREELIKDKRKFNAHDEFKNIEALPEKIPVWLCGYNNHSELHEVQEIYPTLKFTSSTKVNVIVDGKIEVVDEEPYRYVVPVCEMRNSDDDWDDFASKL